MIIVEVQDIVWPSWNTSRIGQIIMCTGGTCGKEEENAFPVPIKELKAALLEKGYKKFFKITESPCLGVCKPHNVSLIIGPNEHIWLGMFRDKDVYDSLLGWIFDSVENASLLPLPTSLEKHRFTRYPMIE